MSFGGRERTRHSRSISAVPDRPGSASFEWSFRLPGFFKPALLFFAGIRLQLDGAPARQEDIPALLPPHPEIPPGAWEQYWFWFAAGAVLLVIVPIAFFSLRRSRPSPPRPLDELAREELSRLRNEPETGAVLSRISRGLRIYLAAAFSMPGDEFTTPEFVSRLESIPCVDSELKSQIGAFLRRCDELKFSQAAPGESSGSALKALEFVNRCDRIRAAANARHAATAE